MRPKQAGVGHPRCGSVWHDLAVLFANPPEAVQVLNIVNEMFG